MLLFSHLCRYRSSIVVIYAGTTAIWLQQGLPSKATVAPFHCQSGEVVSLSILGSSFRSSLQILLPLQFMYNQG